MSIQAIVFDLDGTLVDSSEGIISSFEACFKDTICHPIRSFSSDLIGPPLQESLRHLAGTSDPELLDQLSSNFKSFYDSYGFRKTIPFPGIEQLISSLTAARIPLHIATNKRQRPTSQILDFLGWSELFDIVLSPDSFSPVLPSKAAILSKLLADASLDSNNCLYIGDRLDDYYSARETRIPFALAEWGFEGDTSVFSSDIIRLQRPDAAQLISLFFDRDYN